MRDRVSCTRADTACSCVCVAVRRVCECAGVCVRPPAWMCTRTCLCVFEMEREALVGALPSLQDPDARISEKQPLRLSVSTQAGSTRPQTHGCTGLTPGFPISKLLSLMDLLLLTIFKSGPLPQSPPWSPLHEAQTPLLSVAGSLCPGLCRSQRPLPMNFPSCPRARLYLSRRLRDRFSEPRLPCL